MNVPIIASSIAGISAALVAMGYDDISGITWNRFPVRIGSIWHAEVHHG